MKTRLKQLSVLSVTINLAIFGLVMGCVGILLVVLLAHGNELKLDGPFPFRIPAGVNLWTLPFMIAAGAAVQGAVYSLVYNGIARITGGIVVWTHTQEPPGHD